MFDSLKKLVNDRNPHKACDVCDWRPCKYYVNELLVLYNNLGKEPKYATEVGPL